MTALEAIRLIKDQFNDNWPPPQPLPQALARLEEIASLETTLKEYDVELRQEGPTNFSGVLWHEEGNHWDVDGAQDFPGLCEALKEKHDYLEAQNGW